MHAVTIQSTLFQMEHGGGAIPVSFTDNGINQMLQRETTETPSYSRHFNQAEDFFLKTSREFEIPSFPIHHDVRLTEPKPEYLATLTTVIDRIQPLLPDLFRGLTYMFDPAEILRPTFFQIFRVAGETYVYLLKLDLVFRPQNHIVVERGSNDMTAVYKTNELILEVGLIPVKTVHSENGKLTGFDIEQLISDTWIGETGRGYFVQGIWLDTDLTKFFSKLFIPRGRRLYPYYPFSSKYRTVTHAPIAIDLDSRRKAVPMLHRVKHFLMPHLEEIQKVLREDEFSEGLDTFQRIKAMVPDEWMHFWDDFSLDMYLNDRDMKEFEVLTGDAV